MEPAPLARIARRSAALPLALCAAALPARGDVWIVDSGEPQEADFDSLQDAADAAQDGDTIVVMGGGPAYERFQFADKGLTIVAGSPGARIEIDEDHLYDGSRPSIEIRDLGADQEVVVRGLEVNYGVLVEDCEGGVWIDEMRVAGGDPWNGVCSLGGSHGAEVRNSHRVVFTRSSLIGEASGTSFHEMVTAEGLVLEDATAHLFDCSVSGGQGASGYGSAAQEGGVGIRLQAGTVNLSGCDVAGGAGGMASDCESAHGAGGPGVLFEDEGSVLRRTASRVRGGVADLEPLCRGQLGPAGPAFVGDGTVLTFPGLPHGLVTNSPVDAAAGERLVLDLTGVPGELSVVLAAPDFDPLPLPGGILLPEPSSFFQVSVGPVPASGEVQLSLVPPRLGSSSALTLFTQAVFADPSPAAWIGGASAIVLLDLP